jgi:plastocyanin
LRWRNKPRHIVLAVALLACACNRVKEKPAPAAAAAPHYFEVDPAGAATLRGKVFFRGKKLPPRRISMDAEEACQAMHKSPVLDDRVVAAKGGGLANVFVYVKSGLEGKVFAPAPQPVVLDQRGCRFQPRVVGLRAGQTLAVKNSDPVSHNVHPKPRNNRDWNRQQPPQAPDLERRFPRPEIMIPVKCDVHAWMKCYIGVVDHPFFAVTNATGGFALEGLPAGRYTVAAWHEALGEMTEIVALHEGEQGRVEFVYRGPKDTSVP